jgi:hypothetical protein
MGLFSFPCWSATRAALNIATDAASRDAERAAHSVATAAGSCCADPSDPAAIRARFHA